MYRDLFREREDFKKKAVTTPTVVKKSEATNVLLPKDEQKKDMRFAATPKCVSNKTYMSSGSSKCRFGVLAKVVTYMRHRHQIGDDHPLTIDEILDETNQMDIGLSIKDWLVSEALVNNPKIKITPDQQKFYFTPVYKIRDGKNLLRLLKQYYLKGLGGVLLEDVQESLPHCEKVLRNRASEIIIIKRPQDKKKVLFYNNQTDDFMVDDDFQKLWRSTTVDAMDDHKIDEYLEEHGIRSMQDYGPKKPPLKRKKVMKKRQLKKPRDNEHMRNILDDYEDDNVTEDYVNII